MFSGLFREPTIPPVSEISTAVRRDWGTIGARIHLSASVGLHVLRGRNCDAETRSGGSRQRK